MRIKGRKSVVLLLCCSLLGSTLVGFGELSQIKASGQDYVKALKYAVQFYDANKCGKDAGDNNSFNWRGACHTQDGSDVGLDLSGGYHDCGDHVKFGITQGYAASVLGWSYYEYQDGFKKAGTDDKILQTLKHFTDYLLKCHPTPNVFYYQVGDGGTDHAYWGAPEKQGNRKTIYKVDANEPGSDVAGEASAALSLMYLNYKDIDKTYANKCLAAAKSLYQLGSLKQGTSQGQGFYNSSSYQDDLAWAATWLYQITGEAKYLNDAKNLMNGMGDDQWGMCWDDMKTPAYIQLYKLTKEKTYLQYVKKNIDYWTNQVKTTKGGLKYLNNWGVLRYASAEAMIAMQYYKMSGDAKAKTFAVSQINYILGDNPNKMSYLIGYGDKYPLYPHHRGANGYTYANGDNLKQAKHTLIGALVGGPDEQDQYHDNGSEYVYTEVGIDYNAGFVGAIAALLSDDKSIKMPTEGDKISPSPSQSPSPIGSTSPNKTPVPTVSPTPNKTSTSKAASSKSSTTQFSTSNEHIQVMVSSKVGEQVDQSYQIKSMSDKQIDLSHLKIRYYCNGEKNKEQKVWCDEANLELNTAPWCVDISSRVKGAYKGTYLDITFGMGDILEGHCSLNINIHFTPSDNSAFEESAEKGVDVIYNNQDLTPIVKLDTKLGQSVDQTYTISASGSGELDLSKLIIQYYYETDNKKAESFWCDHAGMQINKEPWYIPITNDVKATFKQGYVEMRFDTDTTLAAEGETLSVQTRFAHSDWSAYSGFVDKGYKVYYDGKLIEQ